MPGKRIVLATFGSLGDLHPYLAIALDLKRAGHRPLLATLDVFREAVESEGIDYARIRPGTAELGDIARIVQRIFHPVRGPEYLMREFMMPWIRESYADLDAVCKDADLIVTQPLAFSGRLIAEKRGLPWVSSVLAPLSLMSAIDPPHFTGLPGGGLVLRKFGIGPYRACFKLMKLVAGGWEKPLHALRAEIGLPPTKQLALFDGQYSPRLNLALFPSLIAEPQADWPANTITCGFARYPGTPVTPELKAELDAFLAQGEPPIVFTLGSSVAMDAGDFFAKAAAVATRLKRRALLVTGQDPPPGLPATMKAFKYLNYAEVFPHAAVNVHQGGIGTLAQALAAGKPQLVMPAAFDQPDNARRAVKLGVARTLPLQRAGVDAMAENLSALLTNPDYHARASATEESIRSQNGARRAAELLSA
jgi:rhamnosyltransferase subunit B